MVDSQDAAITGAVGNKNCNWYFSNSSILPIKSNLLNDADIDSVPCKNFHSTIQDHHRWEKLIIVLVIDWGVSHILEISNVEQRVEMLSLFSS